jgi:hypothetical protein
MSRRGWYLVAGSAGLLLAVSCSDAPTPTSPPNGAAPSFDQGGVPNAASAGNPYRHFFAIRTDTAVLNAAHGGGAGGGSKTTNTGIFYHGGPIIASPKVAAIYWANSAIFSGGPTPGTVGLGSADGSMVGLFLRNLGGSGYWNINSTYADGSGAHVANSLSYAGYWADGNGAPVSGQNVTDGQVQSEVVAGFTSGALAYDPATLYVVFSGPGVNLGGRFGSSYCAYHGHFTWNGNDVKYAVMPYAQTYPSACTAGSGISPISDPAAAAEVNVLAHETEETATDQDLNAWYDRRGYENADKCAWKFGTTQSGATGMYNETIGGVDWLIQMNWVNAGSGGCLQHWP